MDAVSDLATLLATMDPALLADRYVFCTVPSDQEAAVVAASPFATVREAEGLSAVLLQANADAFGLPYDSVHRCITLRVHSSLTAVGLTAVFVRGTCARLDLQKRNCLHKCGPAPSMLTCCLKGLP